MTEWIPLERGKPQVRGIDHEASGVLDVRIELSRTPPRRWDHFFMNPKVGTPVGMRSPRLEGPTVRIRPPHDQLSQYVEHVDARIAYANFRYEQEVLPQIEEQQAQGRAQEDEREERLDRARREAEDL
jgi:hypothetical protein